MRLSSVPRTFSFLLPVKAVQEQIKGGEEVKLADGASWTIYTQLTVYLAANENIATADLSNTEEVGKFQKGSLGLCHLILKPAFETPDSQSCW